MSDDPSAAFPELSIPALDFCARAVPGPEDFGALVDGLFAAEARNNVFVALNPEKVLRSRARPILRDALRGSAANFVDGVGICVAFRLLHRRRVRRTWAFEILLRRLGERRGTVFLYGGSEPVNARAAAEIAARYPGIRVADRCHGYGEADGAALRDRIAALRPDLLVVALGSPKQEEWIWNFGRAAGARFVIGVGGALDAISGAVPRAPRIFRALGVEWLYRLVRQPSRIRRQGALVRFAAAVIGDWWRSRARFAKERV